MNSNRIGHKFRAAIISVLLVMIGATFSSSTYAQGNPISAGNSFIHRATASNTSGHVTYIESALTNGNASAILLVTENRGRNRR